MLPKPCRAEGVNDIITYAITIYNEGEKAGYASQHAFKNNLTLKEAILDLGYLTSEEFDLYVQPEKMIHK